MNSEDKPIIIDDDETERALVFPIPHRDFNEFVSGLLGKPQTIEKNYKGTFEIDFNTIKNIHELLNQRLSQQNKAVLAQFTAKIYFDDDSSVLLNSIDDFLLYNAIHPIISTVLHVSWIYLIKFPDKKVPEKQQIEMTFYSSKYELAIDESDESDDSSDVIINKFMNIFSGRIRLRISHTARTWGVDMEALINSHLSTIIKQHGPLRTELLKARKVISVIFAIIAMLTGATFLPDPKRLNSSAIHELLLSKGGGTNIMDVSKKLDSIIDYLATPASKLTTFMFFLSMCMLGLLTGFVYIGILYLIRHTPYSYILLTQKSFEHKKTTTKSRKRKLLYLILSIIGSIILGVVSSIIYDKYFR